MSDSPPSSEEMDHLVDVCFGKDEEMLAWAKRENLPIFRDDQGRYDWDPAWAAFLERQESKPTPEE